MASQLAQSNGATSAPSGRSVIDTITYLASLVSQPREVDDMLDPLRYITANIGPSKSLTPDNVAELNQVQAQLEDYLIHREPFQKFTPETLHARIADHFDPGRAWRRFVAAIKLAAYSLAILAGIAFAIVQILRTPGLTLHQEIIDVLAPWLVPRLSLLGFVILGLGGLGFLVGALRNIQTRLRPILVLIGLAVASLLAAQATTPLLGAQIPYHQTFGVAGLFTVAAVLIVVALERFLRLLEHPTTPRPILVAAIAITLVAAVVSPIAAYSLAVVWAGLGVWRCRQVITRVGIYFQQALRPLAAVLSTLAIGMLLLGVERLVWAGDVTRAPIFMAIMTYLVILACAGLCVEVGRRFDQAGRT